MSVEEIREFAQEFVNSAVTPADFTPDTFEEFLVQMVTSGILQFAEQSSIKLTVNAICDVIDRLRQVAQDLKRLEQCAAEHGVTLPNKILPLVSSICTAAAEDLNDAVTLAAQLNQVVDGVWTDPEPTILRRRGDVVIDQGQSRVTYHGEGGVTVTKASNRHNGGGWGG